MANIVIQQIYSFFFRKTWVTILKTLQSFHKVFIMTGDTFLSMRNLPLPSAGSASITFPATFSESRDTCAVKSEQ